MAATLWIQPLVPQWILPSLTSDGFELIRPHLRTAASPRDLVPVKSTRRSSAPTCRTDVISLVVKRDGADTCRSRWSAATASSVHVSALGDPTALNGALVSSPPCAPTIDLDRLGAALGASADAALRCWRPD